MQSLLVSGSYVVVVFRSCASFSQYVAVYCFWMFFVRFLLFGSCVNILVSWCLVPCTLSGFWSDLVTDYVSFAAWRLPIAKNCMKLFFDTIVINIWYLLDQLFDLMLPFLNYIHINFFKFTCNLLNIFCRFYHLVRLWVLSRDVSAMHPSDLWSDLVTDYVLFAAWNLPVAKKCLKLIFWYNSY